ncbi:PepSY domain-containing protein [Dyella jejuensis]
MAWLHTWAGLIVGWVLFVIFLGGTLACFDKELDYWMRPALHRMAPGAVSMDAAAASLRAMAPHAGTFYLEPPTSRDPSIHGLVFEPGKPYIDVAFNPHDGQLIPGTVGGTFFFTLHYDLEAGTIGVYLVGLAGMLMLLALVSGVIIHRRIFKDFFMFRPGGGQRAWLDGHNLTGVLGLPFHLMIAYTGVAIMMSSYMFAGVQVAYRGDMGRFFQELAGAPVPLALHRPPPRRASLDAVLADAVRRLDGPAQYMQVDRIHDASTTISVLAAGNDQVAGGRRTLLYNGVTGAFMAEAKGPETAYRTYQFLSGLHRVQFGGTALRWLYFLLGGAGCVMLACGMQVWIAKRARQAALAGLRSGYGLVRALNVGVLAGMPLACIALLWVNRLLPASLIGRADWEARGFWAAWWLAAFWGIGRMRRGNPWRELFAATAALLLALPLINALTCPYSSLLHSVHDRDWTLAGVDLTAFVLGLAFAWLAYQCGPTDTPEHPTTRTRQATGRRIAANRASTPADEVMP